MGFEVGSFFHDMLPAGAMQSDKIVEEITTDTTTVGAIIDTQGYNRILFNFFTGVLQDGDYDVQLFHGDDSAMADEAEVDASDINGTLPNWTEDTDDDKVESVELVCRKRYFRVKVVSTGTTNGAYVGALASLGNPDHAPVQTP